MDLSLRTFVNGWKAIYLTETTCINEVSPSVLYCAFLAWETLSLSALEESAQAVLYSCPLHGATAHTLLACIIQDGSMQLMHIQHQYWYVASECGSYSLWLICDML